jgi:hypothetical protein
MFERSIAWLVAKGNRASATAASNETSTSD